MDEKLKLKAVVEEKDGKLIAVASEEVEDREGEKITIDGWKLDNFKKNPVMLWGHDPTEPTIGKAENIKKKVIDGAKKLVFEPVFHEISEKSALISKLVKAGFLNSFSVGFMPLEKDGNTYTKQELLEISVVNVPALPTATIISRAKKLGISEKELKDLNLTTKPFANEHACRLKSPDNYDKFARKNCEAKVDGKCIDYIYGIKEGKSELQSMRFDKKVWSVSEAEAYCKEKKGKFEPSMQAPQADTKPENTKSPEPKSPVKGDIQAKPSTGAEKGCKSCQGDKETINAIKTASKALELGFQKPKYSRRGMKIAYRALEQALQNNGKRKQ